MTEFLDFVDDWGLKVGYIIGGGIGGIIFMNSGTKRKRPTWEKITIVFTGIVTANYITPLLIWILNIPDGVEFGISFIIGYMGLNGLGLIIDNIRDRIKRR